jgi:hypothetical protein
VQFNLVDYLDIYSMLKFIQTGGKTDGTGDKIVRTFTPSQLKAVIIRLRKYPFIRLLGRPSLLMLVSNVRSFTIQKSLIVFFLFTWAIIPLLSRILMVMLSRKRKKNENFVPTNNSTKERLKNSQGFPSNEYRKELLMGSTNLF